MASTVTTSCKLAARLCLHPSKNGKCLVRFASFRSKDEEEEEIDKDGFRVFKIPGLKRDSGFKDQRKYLRKFKEKPPRTLKMKPDQDWVSVWPTVSSFKWSAVPLPVKQGFLKNESENNGLIPDKYANLELMKIPNFFHLTPGHIKRQCQAIKEFCTDFPNNLALAEDSYIKNLYPVEVITSDYCFSGPSIRDPRARKATVKLNLSSLNLDNHARDKMIRLVGERYDKKSDEISIVTDRCPTKKQNYDHAMYLFTVLYHESRTVEPWEEEKSLEDMEQYIWNINQSKQNIITLLQTINEHQKESGEQKTLDYLPEETSEQNLIHLPQVTKYKDSVENLMNKGDNPDTIESYKQSVLELLNIKLTKPKSHSQDEKSDVVDENLAL